MTGLRTAVLGLLACTSVFADGGEVVHAYSNVNNYIPLRVVRPKVARPVRVSYSPAAAPLTVGTEVLSFSRSANQQLAPRFVSSYSWNPSAQQWDPAQVPLHAVIQEQARLNDIDPLVIECIIHHESNFDPAATSGVGAQGLMQLMPTTAADLGITNAFDAQQNVAAGTRYFAEQYRRFGDLERALAAYNAGPGNVEAYGGVPPFAETQNYVASISSEYLSRRKKRA